GKKHAPRSRGEGNKYVPRLRGEEKKHALRLREQEKSMHPASGASHHPDVERWYSRHAPKPNAVDTRAASARVSALVDSNGARAPATSALITRLTNACSDDTAPRWRGKRSSSSRVRVGKLMPMPIACRPIGITDHGTRGAGRSQATPTLIAAATSMIA